MTVHFVSTCLSGNLLTYAHMMVSSGTVSCLLPGDCGVSFLVMVASLPVDWLVSSYFFLVDHVFRCGHFTLTEFITPYYNSTGASSITPPYCLNDARSFARSARQLISFPSSSLFAPLSRPPMRRLFILSLIPLKGVIIRRALAFPPPFKVKCRLPIPRLRTDGCQ